MDNSKLVSVLIPVYNVEKYVFEAINSILNQTYKNLEIIIVDDCSSDKTYEIILEMAKKDKRIKIFKNKENKKICYSLNFAFNMSNGYYIARMDGDDISLLDKIEKQVKYLEENKKIDLVGVSTISIDEKGNEISKQKFISKYEKLRKTLEYGPPISHIWLSKRSVYEILKGYREIPYVEDYDFLLRMETEGLKFENIGDYFGYKVRTRQGNTASTNGVKQRKAFFYVLNLYKERLKQKTDSYSEKKFYKYIESTSEEEYSYSQAYIYLKKSLDLKSKRNKIWIFYFFRAASKSKYLRLYIFERIKFKIIQRLNI